MATFATVEVYPLIIQQYDEEPSGGSGSSRSFVVIGTVLLCLSAILFLHSQLAVSHSLLPAEVEATTFLHGVSAGSAVPDVFCFTVMGQPDLERALLLSQQKGKGSLVAGLQHFIFTPCGMMIPIDCPVFEGVAGPSTTNQDFFSAQRMRSLGKPT